MSRGGESHAFHFFQRGGGHCGGVAEPIPIRFAAPSFSPPNGPLLLPSQHALLSLASPMIHCPMGVAIFAAVPMEKTVTVAPSGGSSSIGCGMCSSCGLIARPSLEDPSVAAQDGSSAAFGMSPPDVCSLTDILSQNVLAFRFGLSNCPKKMWRFRDFRRGLFSKLSPDHLMYIHTHAEHSVVRQRLPHRMSLRSFALRLLLLCFHYVIAEGRVPSFWAKMNLPLMAAVLPEECLVYSPMTAQYVYRLIQSGLSVEDALSRVGKRAKGEIQAEGGKGDRISSVACLMTSGMTSPARRFQWMSTPLSGSGKECTKG